MSVSSGPRFVKFLYNHNPFYLISAAIVLYGFQSTVDQQNFQSHTWLLLGLFSGYTILLASTAWLIVRFGKVWDDARSIFMVLVLLFMALSASMDGLFASAKGNAVLVSVAGFTLAIATAESLIRSLGIRFHAFYRGPLYLMFAVSYLFPCLFIVRSIYFDWVDIRYIILMFPFAASASILALIPSIRLGRRCAAKNHTPWLWPMFPYSIFVLAIVGLIGRTIFLTLAFDASKGSGMLGTWLFVPMLLSISWVVFEIGKREQIKGLQIFSMSLAPISLLLARQWPLFTNSAFYDELSNSYGSPVWITLCLIVMIYVLMHFKGAKCSEVFTAASLIFAAFLNPSGQIANGVEDFQSWPLLLLGVGIICSWSRIACSKSWTAAAVAICIPIGNFLTPWVTWLLSDLNIMGKELFATLGVLVVAAVIISSVFNDRFSKQLRIIVGLSFASLAIIVTSISLIRNEFSTGASTLCALIVALSLLIYVCKRSSIHLVVAIVSLSFSVISFAPAAELRLASSNSRLIAFFIAGILCLLVGLLVSAKKAGWTSKLTFISNWLMDEISEAFMHEVTPHHSQSSI